jgi:hypothetical protein
MMTITELIAKLEEIKSTYGDLPVYRTIWDGSNEENIFDVILREPHSYEEGCELPLRIVFD